MLTDGCDRAATATRTWGEILDEAEAFTAELEPRVDLGTVLSVLHWLNGPDAHRQVSELYYDRTGSITDPGSGRYAGADMVANFYRRNLHIAANLRSIAEPGDRVTVLFGQAHVPFLAHILEAAGDRFVDPLPYLDASDG